MATRRQVIKDIKNKQSQAREDYACNKSLLGEYQVKEKAGRPTGKHKTE